MKKKDKIKFICICAISIALFVALDAISITTPIGKVTFSGFPLIIVSLLYGPLAGMIVGGCGEFIYQLIAYGFDPLIILWVIPPLVRGLFVGLFKLKKDETKLKIGKTFIVIILSGIILTILNTGVIWLHSVVFEYYSYEYVFGNFIYRLIITAVTSCLYAGASIPLVPLLKK